MKVIRTALVCASMLLAGTAQAVVVNWTDWTSSNLTSAAGIAGGVSVNFTGLLQFAQLESGVMVGSGASSTTNYWTEPDPLNRPYTGNAVVDNAPTAFELLAFNRASVNQVTFGSPVTNPVMAIVSQGQLGLPVNYNFDTPFTVLSEGRGFWGDGTFTLGPFDQLVGRELHAVIQFGGTVSAIGWTSSEENWHGFNFGLLATSVPEPATLALLGLGLGMVGWRRHRTS